MRFRNLHILAALALLACQAAGCRDEGPEVGNPLLPAGRIQGTVTLGREPSDVTVRATRGLPGRGDFSWFETKVGTDGTYSVDVPAGRYVLGLVFDGNYNPTYTYSAAGPRYGDAPPDTLLVDGSQITPLIADFPLGSLHVTMPLPAHPENEVGRVNLTRRSSSWPVQGNTAVTGDLARLQGGTLDFDVIGILPGSYRVEVITGYGDGEHFWYPGVRDSAQSPWIDVVAGREQTVTGQPPGAPARIQGRITGAWQEFGMETPYLALIGPDSSVVRGPRHVAADGSFDEALDFPGPVKLLVRQGDASAGYGVDQWVGGAGFADASVFALTSGQTIAGVECVESGLYVRVTAPVQLVENAWFRFFDAATMTLATSARIDYSKLEFGIANLRPGTYRLRIEADFNGWRRWVPQWYDRALTAAEATPITIGYPGAIVNLPLVLERGGSIAGIVSDAQAPAVDHPVYVTPAGSLEAWGYLVAYAPAQQFLLEGLPDGDWKVGASRSRIEEQPPADTVWYPGGTWENATVISTRGYSDVTGIVISLPASGR